MIGVISDVHGNKTALRAVLEDMPTVDWLVCCGDIVGYGPDPRECVEELRDRVDVSVQGNHDRHIVNPTTYSNPLAVEGLRHAQNELYAEHFDWLLALPRMARERGIAVTHSHPEDDERRVEGSDALGVFEPHVTDEAFFLVGHTHQQYSRTSSDGWTVVNPGSVGQPRDGDPRAAYALIDADTGDVDLRRVTYDIDSVVRRIRETGLPEEMCSRLRDAV